MLSGACSAGGVFLAAIRSSMYECPAIEALHGQRIIRAGSVSHVSENDVVRKKGSLAGQNNRTGVDDGASFSSSFDALRLDDIPGVDFVQNLLVSHVFSSFTVDDESSVVP